MVRARKRPASPTTRPSAPRPAAHAVGHPPWLAGAVIVLFVARPLFPSEATASMGDGLPVVMLWLAVGLLWLLATLSRRRWEVRFGWIDLAVGALVGWHTIAGLYAAWHAAPRPAVNTLWEWIGLGMAFLLARQWLVGPRIARASCAVMVALAAGVSAYGLCQYSLELPATRAYYEQNPKAALKEAGLDVDLQSREARLFRDRVYSTEPMATFALTNSLAGFLVPWMVVALGIALSPARATTSARPDVPENASGPNGTNRSVVAAHSHAPKQAHHMAAVSQTALRLRLGAVACAVLMATVLLLTKSRTAYIAAGAGLALLARLARQAGWRLGWHWLAGLGATGVILVALAAAIGGLDVLVLLEAGKSALYRLQYWYATLGMIGDHLWLGCGPGNFQAAYTRYMLPTASEEIADPHNFLLEVWATAGTPSALALLAVVSGLVRLALRPESNVVEQDAAAEVVRDGSPRPVLLGGLCGMVLSVPLGMLSSAPPGVVPVLIGLPVAGGVLWLLWPWIQGGQLRPGLPAAAALALAINLLGAGGIGFAGVAGSLWLLLALAIGCTRQDRPRPIPRYGAWLGLGATLLAAVACYLTAYNPVLRCRALLDRAGREPLWAQQHLHKAALADRWSAEPWKRLADNAMHQWRNHPTDEALCVAAHYQGRVAALSPDAASPWFVLGQMYDEAFQVSPAKRYAKEAAAAYHQAVMRYPTNARFRAALALALRSAGDNAGFAREAKEALRLDAGNPHLDRKLPAELCEQLNRNLGEAGRP